ncbi:MAG TPA: DUF4389 domain-containing protein [Acidimicrobiales bacterium]|nr:DUF4389 domain-containing protein [Acidimicrobiales bacterium]
MRYAHRRNRLSVAFRLILVVPQVVVVYGLGIASFVVAVLGWFGALILGRLPRWVAEFQANALAWYARVHAYGLLLVDSYPPFRWYQDEAYPVRLRLDPGRLNRGAVLFRLILGIPAYVVSVLAITGAEVVSVVVWVILVVSGRMPRPLFQAMVSGLRYYVRFAAYGYLLLTATYPTGLFEEPLLLGRWPDGEELPQEGSSAGHATTTSWPPASWSVASVPLGGAAKWLVALLIVVGAVAQGAVVANDLGSHPRRLTRPNPGVQVAMVRPALEEADP